MAKRVLDNIERDVVAAMKLGYGVHYGRYKADYPHTKADDVTAAVPKPAPEAEERAFCVLCGTEFLRSHGCQKYCSDECRRSATKARWQTYYQRKKTEPRPVVCPECGKTFLPANGRQKYCTHLCTRKANQKKRTQRRREERYGNL